MSAADALRIDRANETALWAMAEGLPVSEPGDGVDDEQIDADLAFMDSIADALGLLKDAAEALADRAAAERVQALVAVTESRVVPERTRLLAERLLVDAVAEMAP